MKPKMRNYTLSIASITITFLSLTFGSALGLPTATDALSQPHLYNNAMTTSLATWPKTPFEVPILDSGSGDILRFTWVESPDPPLRPPDRAKILSLLSTIADDLVAEGNPSDPMDYDLDKDCHFGAPILALKPNGTHPRITRKTFLVILNTVIRLFKKNGLKWFESQIQRGGETIAIFEMLYAFQGKALELGHY